MRQSTTGLIHCPLFQNFVIRHCEVASIFGWRQLSVDDVYSGEG